MKQERSLSTKFIIFSLIGFILFWSLLTDAWGYSKLIFSDSNLIIGEFVFGYVNRIIWVIPAVLLIYKFDNKLFINRNTLFSRPKLNKFFIITLIIITIYCVVGMFVMYKGVHFNTNNIVLLVVKMIIVGIVEETVFRGWGYNALCKVTSNKRAMILSSLMFSLIHCPAYIIKYLLYGNFDIAGLIGQCIIAFAWGIIFCTMLRKGKSLWAPIFMHSFFDIISTLLI